MVFARRQGVHSGTCGGIAQQQPGIGQQLLLSEEYDPVNNTMAGNFPQAFSHLALVRAADALNAAAGQREKPQPEPTYRLHPTERNR